MRGAVAQAHDRQPADGLVVVAADQAVEDRPRRVHRAGAVAGEQLERDQRGAPARGALVVEPAGEQLDLLPVAELAEGTIRDRPLAVVAAARGRLDLVVPLSPQVGELPLVARFCELGSSSRCLLEGQGAWPPFSERGAGPT